PTGWAPCSATPWFCWRRRTASTARASGRCPMPTACSRICA
ncbi:MAG: CRISPR-associated protein Cas5, partial [Thiohalorhabdaceae bacterium]